LTSPRKCGVNTTERLKTKRHVLQKISGKMLGKRRVAPCNYNESESGSDFDSDSDTDPPRKMATQRRSQVQQCQSKKALHSKPIEDSSSSKELDPSYGHGPPYVSHLLHKSPADRITVLHRNPLPSSLAKRKRSSSSMLIFSNRPQNTSKRC
jgi:hypothetical protein